MTQSQKEREKKKKKRESILEAEIMKIMCPIRFNGLPVSDERCGQFG